MSGILALSLVVLLVLGVAVVGQRRLVRQALLGGLFGLALAGCAVLLQAPEVALAQAVVSGFAVPTLVVLTLLRVGEVGGRPDRRRRDRGGPAEGGERR